MHAFLYYEAPFRRIDLYEALDMCGWHLEGASWRSIRLLVTEVKQHTENDDVYGQENVYWLAAKPNGHIVESDIFTKKVEIDWKKLQIQHIQSFFQKLVFQYQLKVILKSDTMDFLPYFLVLTNLWKNALANDGMINLPPYHGMLAFYEQEVKEALEKRGTPHPRDWLAEFGTPATMAIKVLAENLGPEFVKTEEKKKVLEIARKFNLGMPDSNLERLIIFLRNDK